MFNLCLRLPLGMVSSLVLMALTVLGSAGPARADWLKAESRNFVVYSSGTESALREYVEDLETYDWVLRIWTGQPVGQTPPRKLPIYLLTGVPALRQVVPAADQLIGGVYFGTTEDVFAVALRNTDNDFLFHEYAHHFFQQNFPNVAFPGWLSEGLAEYYMTVEVSRGTVELGNYSPMRGAALTSAVWPPFEDLLSKRYGQIERDDHRASYYPLSWLLTHWFMSDETRKPWLDLYLADIRAGGDPVGAMERVTGQSMAELTQTLRAYLRGGIRYARFADASPPAEITISRMPRSADDVLLLGQRIKLGVPEEMEAETLTLVRRAAAKHPDDPLALLVLGHAELHMGDAVEGERILQRLLEIDPDNVDGLQLMASARLKQAEDHPEEARTLLNQARGFLARAYAVRRDDYVTLYYNALSREGAETYPNENDMRTWEQAFILVPQLAPVRLGFASALIHRGERDLAIHLLTPLANAPHGGPAAEAAQALIETARSGGAPPSLEDLEDDSASDTPAEPQADAEAQGPQAD